MRSVCFHGEMPNLLEFSTLQACSAFVSGVFHRTAEWRVTGTRPSWCGSLVRPRLEIKSNLDVELLLVNELCWPETCRRPGRRGPFHNHGMWLPSTPTSVLHFRVRLRSVHALLTLMAAAIFRSDCQARASLALQCCRRQLHKFCAGQSGSTI